MTLKNAESENPLDAIWDRRDTEFKSFEGQKRPVTSQQSPVEHRKVRIETHFVNTQTVHTHIKIIQNRPVQVGESIRISTEIGHHRLYLHSKDQQRESLRASSS